MYADELSRVAEAGTGVHVSYSFPCNRICDDQSCWARICADTI